MKRFALPVCILLSWLFLVGIAAAQSGLNQGEPPQGDLFNDGVFLARLTPFMIALGIIVGIFQARKAIQKGGDAIVGDRVERHDVSNLIAHWTNVIGFVLGLITGAIVLGWVAVEANLRLLFIIHYFGAALILFAMFNHLTRHGVTGGTGLIPKTLGVIRDLIGELFEYLGLFGPEGAVFRIPWPRAIRQPIARYVRALLDYREDRTGKFLATEQILSYPPWTILTILIVGSGLIKVLRYIYPISASVVATATAVHDLTTIAIVVMLLFHLLPLLLVPANWPLLLSMFKKTVPRKYVEERHPKWYESLRAGPVEQEQPGAASSGQSSAQTADV